nr:nitroreductase/quinone reductase family protein [Jiangella mangrovi]
MEVLTADRASGGVVVVSGFGRAADWYRNVHAAGHATIETGRRRFQAVPRDLGADEAAAVLASYERWHRLIAPIVRRVLSSGRVALRRQ